MAEALPRKVGLGVWAILVVGSIVSGAETSKVRPAYCAGTWYPGQPAELSREVDKFLAGAPSTAIEGKPRALIVPHAGYRYSAPVAASAYKMLSGHRYKRVIILAFSHRYAGSYRGVDLPGDLEAYATPLGDVPIDREAIAALARQGIYAHHPGVDRGEHSLELQLPLLQRSLKDFQLVPLLVGRMSVQDYAAAAKALQPMLDDDTLLVASSDFTHFGPNFGYEPFRDKVPERLRDMADRSAKTLCACDFDGFADYLDETDDTICGQGPILLLVRALSMQGGAHGIRTAFDTSGHQTGDYVNSVTYQALVLTRPPGTLDRPSRAACLKLARDTVTAALNKQPAPQPDPETLPAGLRRDGACFVTLMNHGRLRGCIGNMAASGPLYEAVIDNAISAATRDYRFANDPVTAAELPELGIEISYLTPMTRVADVREIVVGRHGLLIALGSQRGVLLPQVAYERGWTREEFLMQTCRKAGLSADAWKDPEAQIHSFTAEVFGEAESAPTSGPH